MVWISFANCTSSIVSICRFMRLDPSAILSPRDSEAVFRLGVAGKCNRIRVFSLKSTVIGFWEEGFPSQNPLISKLFLLKSKPPQICACLRIQLISNRSSLKISILNSTQKPTSISYWITRGATLSVIHDLVKILYKKNYGSYATCWTNI